MIFLARGVMICAIKKAKGKEYFHTSKNSITDSIEKPFSNKTVNSDIIPDMKKDIIPANIIEKYFLFNFLSSGMNISHLCYGMCMSF